MKFEREDERYKLPLARLFNLGLKAARLDRLLAVVRQHLGMDVAFVSRFRKKDRVLEFLDSETTGPLEQGQVIPLQEGYCLKVVRGELPQCIPDTASLPATQSIAATHAIPIGAHLSVPIRLSDGRIYGTLCCFSHTPRQELDARDVRILEAFAEVLAIQFDETFDALRENRTSAQQVRSIIRNDALSIIYQPVYSLADIRLRAFECLSRIEAEPRQPPDWWFNLAHRVGLGVELEKRALIKALDSQQDFPVPIMLCVNSSPALILTGTLPALFVRHGYDTSRIILELTEHAIVRDYRLLAAALAPLREMGIKLAVDDTGAGYASMSHILELAPEIIKLDKSIIHSIDTDRKRWALARGLTSFAHEIGSKVIAEGVETASDLASLARLGVDEVQGYFFAKPMPRNEALALCRPGSARS